MRFLIASLLAILSLGAPRAQVISQPTIWTLIQDKVVSCTVSASSCAVAVTSTVAGDAGVMSLSSGSVTISSITGDTFTHCTAQGGTLGTCNVSDVNVDDKDASYITSLAGSATSFTVNFSGTETFFATAEFMELRKVGNQITADASGAVDDSTVCQWCAGPSLTISGNDAIVCNADTSNGFGLVPILSPYRQNGGNATGSAYSGYVFNATTAPVLQFANNGIGQAQAWCIAFK